MVLSTLERDIVAAHEEGEVAFKLGEVGLPLSASGVAQAQAAYDSLVSQGIMAEVGTIRVMPHQGGVPCHPFKLTPKGMTILDELPGMQSSKA